MSLTDGSKAIWHSRDLLRVNQISHILGKWSDACRHCLSCLGSNLACLIASNRGAAPHGLCSAESPDQIIVFQHALHRVSQGNRDCQWQAFGDSNNLQGDKIQTSWTMR